LPKIAVTGDYTRIAASVADWSLLGPSAEVQFFHDPFASEDEVIEKLCMRDAILEALKVPSVQAHLTDMGGEAHSSIPEEMTAMVSSDLKKWITVVNEAYIPKQ
jgi:tripartite-type tricarboxylate transporter receptor subunit TctC